MKWIKKRDKFLSEAKIKDVVFPRQAKEITKLWGEQFLEYDEIEATDKIKQGTWKLSEEDKRRVLGVFFNTNIGSVYNVFESLPDKFVEIFSKCIDVNLIKEDKREIWRKTLETFDIKSPSLDQICLLYENVFKKLAVAETQADEYIKKGADGRPERDEAGQMIKIKKEKGSPVFTNNLVNINSFISDYNRCYPDNQVSSGFEFERGCVFNIRNATAEDANRGQYKYDFELFGKDMNLTILHRPKDILNMSISKFYASCQHLYTGGWRTNVIGNVFDPNSIPAYLRFETPITWEGEQISDFVPIGRMMIRNMEGFKDSKDTIRLYFDRCYPDRLQNIMQEMVTKYSENVGNHDGSGRYLWTPDIAVEDEAHVNEPYMDRMSLTRGKYIGQNTKVLYLTAHQDWSNTIISPKAKIKELVIETIDLPKNMFEVPFNLEWVKFKFINIKTLKDFTIKTDSWAFDKCKLNNKVLQEIVQSNPEIKKLQFVACELSELDLSVFEKLDELQMLYSLEENSNLENILKGNYPKSIILSGDLLSNEENKKFINKLKQKGVKVKIEGLVV